MKNIEREDVLDTKLYDMFYNKLYSEALQDFRDISIYLEMRNLDISLYSELNNK